MHTTTLLGALLLLAPAADPGAQPPQQTLLPGGLSVIIVPQPRHPLVTVQTWLQLGSVDDEPGHEGAARLLVQVLYDGGKRFGRDGATAAVQAVGGRTVLRVDRERAVLSTTLPSSKLELALQIAADRLRAPQLDAARIERAQAELQALGEVPGDEGPARTLELLQALAYLTHPLRQPPLGWWHRSLADPLRSCRALLDAHVAPARTAIVIAGDVEAGRALALVKKHLANWAQRKAQPRRGHLELPVEGVRRLQVEQEGPGWLALGWRTPGLAHVDAPALAVLIEALRDEHAALRPGVAVPGRADARADWLGFSHHGLLRLWLPLEPSQDPDGLESALRTSVEDRLRALDDAALLSARARVRAARLQQHAAVEDLAFAVGQAALVRGGELQPEPELARLDALTPAALREVASRLLVPAQLSAVWTLAQPRPAPPRHDAGSAR